MSLAFSFFSKSSATNSRDTKPSHPKDAEGPSVAKGSFSGLAFLEIALLITTSQTRQKIHRQVLPGQRGQKRSPHPLQTSLNTLMLPLVVRHKSILRFMQGRMISAHLLLTPRSLQNQKRKAKMPAPFTDSKEPVSKLPASDALPGAPPASESTDPRPVAISKETAATGATLKGDSTPKSDQGPETERRREFERRRTLIIHTRLARFFTWILLFAFVILPGTFSRVQNNQSNSQDGLTNPKQSTATKVIDEIANLPLYAILCFPLPSRL